MDMKYLLLTAALAVSAVLPLSAQDTSLSRHPFAYVGEYDTRHPEKQTLFIVRDGKEIIVPTEGTKTHGQFRHVRMTREGHFVTGLIHEQIVAEIDMDGRLVRSIPGQKAWHVDKLDNGNYLIGGDNRGYVREFDRNGGLVWEYTREDAPFPLYNLQTATRLSNGNTLITSWVAGRPKEEWPGSVQFFEVTPAKEVVWKVASWDNPDLGPCTYLDLLDEPRRKRPRHWDGTPAMMNDAPNRPLGEGKGIHPGRVAWVHAPGVAAWDGKTGLWSDPRWNSQEKADAMLREALVALTGEKTPRKAWKALFRDFNKTHGKGETGYRKGEKVAIKLNMNNTLSYSDSEELNSSPYVTLALLRSLVRDGGVPQEDITLTEPSRWLTDNIFLRCKAEFPRVTYEDNVGKEGRSQCAFYMDAMPFTPGKGENQKGLAKSIVDALSFSDSYLVEAATIPESPSGTRYDPEQDGVPLDRPLGLHEHWNSDRQYKYIDLIYKKL